MSLLSLMLLVAAPAQSYQSKTYLASVKGIELRHDEMLERFSLSTWGANFQAVCHIPSGWTIKASNNLTGDGVLEGGSSHGVTMPRDASPKELRSLVLVELSGPVRSRDTPNEPATFKGYATAWADDAERKIPLTAKNIRLVPAQHCPL